MQNKFREYARRNTSTIIALGLGLGIFIIFLPIIMISIRNTVRAGEIRSTELEVNRTLNVLQNEVNHVYKNLGDWSYWNDTYDFAINQNRSYIENNIADETFTNLDINQFVVLNSSNEIVFASYYDNTEQTQIESPVDISALLAAYPVLLSFDGNVGNKGFGYFQDHAMILTSNPILTSLNEGPVAGTLIFIKYLDQHELEQLSQLTLRTLDLLPSDKMDQTDFQVPSSKELGSSVFVNVKDRSTIAGYLYLPDLQSDPKLVLEVRSPRFLYQQGNSALILITIVLSILVVLFSIIAYYFTQAILRARERKKDEEISAQLLVKTRQNAIELERRVEERTRELELINKELQDFNYSVSHDLKTPLRGISGFTTLLMSDYGSQLDQTGKTYLKNIADSSARMNTLIEDLLAYTRSERHEIIHSEINLELFFEQLMKNYQKEIEHRGTKVISDFQCGTVITDREALAIIMRNLLDNAFKFSAQAENPTITLVSSLSDHTYRISVSDNGIGFNMQFHEKIFDLFQRLHLNEDYPGTGIGLALVKKSVMRLGGRVYASSTPGKGATFFVELPAQ